MNGSTPATPHQGDPRSHDTRAPLRFESEIISAVLVILTVAVFWQVKNCEFLIYDDPDYVTANVHVQRGLSWAGVVWAFTSYAAFNWHPLTWISHMLDVTVFGQGPRGPHLVNLGFHAANAVLIFLVLKRMTGALWKSALVAALFAVHPLHVEPVAWIAERKDVLSTFFALLALWTYAAYVETTRNRAHSAVQPPSSSSILPSMPAARSSGFWYGATLAFFALGLMSKPMVVTLPFVLLLLDFWPLNRLSLIGRAPAETGFEPAGKLIFEKIPFLALSVFAGVITFLAQQKEGAVHTLTGLPLTARLGNAFVSYARYLGKTFWPSPLAIPYPHPGQWPVLQVVACLTLVLLLTACALWLGYGRRMPFLIVGWFWFLGTLVPVIGLVQVGMQSMADRYTYMPLLGFFIALVWSAGWLAEYRKWGGRFPGILAVLILGACSVQTMNQLRYWQNSEKLFSHSIAVTRDNYDAYVNLGAFLYEKGQLTAAAEAIGQALRIHPEEAGALNRMGSICAGQKDFEQAVQYYQQALRVRPDFTDTHNNLGVIYRQLGQPEKAIQEYRQALRSAPHNAEAHNNIANLLVSEGKTDEAMTEYRLALEDNPWLTQALNNLALSLAGKGRADEAVVCYQKALKIKPHDPMLHENFGDILAGMGRNQDAAQQYRQAMQLAPNDPEAHFGLGRALARLGSTDEAVLHLKEALRLNPNDPDAQRELQRLLQPQNSK